MLLPILAAEGPNGSQIPADVNEVYWGSLAFFVIMGVLIWKAGPAIMKALNGRTDRIQRDFDEAQAARLSAENALSATAADTPDIAAESARIKKEAEETASRLRVDTAARAKAEAEAMRERAANDIQNQTAQALADLREEIASLTRSSTEILVSEKLDAGSQSDLIDSYISSLERS
ncbi:MAG: ATP synthase F0 subunit B [Acidimicrobiia bacterium]|nr:ATP synthase F0 subunit B [Acidimicrobiia bacterium]